MTDKLGMQRNILSPRSTGMRPTAFLRRSVILTPRSMVPSARGTGWTQAPMSLENPFTC
jgi:hypothetical protein